MVSSWLVLHKRPNAIELEVRGHSKKSEPAKISWLRTEAPEMRFEAQVEPKSGKKKKHMPENANSYGQISLKDTALHRFGVHWFDKYEVFCRLVLDIDDNIQIDYDLFEQR